jgi:hypothetical protein
MVLTADTPRIPRTITAFPICLSLPVAHCLFMYPPPLMCRKCPMVIWIITLLFRFLCDDSQHHVVSLDAPFQMLSAHYLSTHLCFSLYVNTCSRSRTSLHVAILFGDSNRPTLFICYPGSIEKLTLLGAIYYYYYYCPPLSRGLIGLGLVICVIFNLRHVLVCDITLIRNIYLVNNI